MSTFRNLVRAIMLHSPKAPAYDDAKRIACSMRRAAAKAHRLNERRCSDFLFSAKDEQNSERLDAKFGALCADLGCKALINHDPRGAAFSIIFHEDYDDGLGFTV